MKTELIVLAIGMMVNTATFAEGFNWGKLKEGLTTYVLNPVLLPNNPELVRGKVVGEDASAVPEINSKMTSRQITFAISYYEKLFDQKVSEFIQANRDDLDLSRKIKILCEAESAAINVMQVHTSNGGRKDLSAAALKLMSEKDKYYNEQRREMVYEQRRLNGSNVNCFDYFPYK
ncbi:MULTISPECIES: hypothetical protein [Acinetobacter]|uniref:hypothetical protein n=1 Tax=Acinetobacter TaxID=469 RepID=UPI000B3D4DC8|nr:MULTISPECIES: hypothetical protein [Acinetobacter]AXY60712.1 hypothetical protein CDG61_12185 [Acinetobacter sp. WCHAc010052]WOE40753.1 hypothetical protein QSG87_12775 [Acinetobacter chinensis]